MSWWKAGLAGVGTLFLGTAVYNHFDKQPKIGDVALVGFPDLSIAGIPAGPATEAALRTATGSSGLGQMNVVITQIPPSVSAARTGSLYSGSINGVLNVAFRGDRINGLTRAGKRIS